MWKKTIKDLSNKVPKKYLDWMTKPYKLGDALRQVCQQVSVNVIEQSMRMPYEDEFHLINIEDEFDKKDCFVREVILEGDHVPFVFARVVIPDFVHEKYVSDFDQLGTKLIGETMLYKSHTTLRGHFEYAELPPEHALHVRANACLPQEHQNENAYWARRSVFYLDGSFPILITEIFTASIPNMSANANFNKLFSYGTLQQEAVQLATFGRKLNGMSDVLIGFVLSQLEIKDPSVIKTSGLSTHPILNYTGLETDTIAGMVFDVTPEQVQQSDEYEVDDYRRMAAKLESGEHAWVYVNAMVGKR